MKNTTSDKILDYLQKHPPASTSEISSALLLTKANIRYHLKHLLQVGVVSRRLKTLDSGAGRPGYHYTISTVEPNSGYSLLARICTEILFKGTSRERTKAGKDIVAGLAGGFHDNATTGSQRLGAAVQYLNKLGYQAIWEARPGHPVVFFRNCPYLNLALEQRGLCQMDLMLVEQLSGWECEQNRRIRDNFRQISSCKFSLINPQ